MFATWVQMPNWDYKKRVSDSLQMELEATESCLLWVLGNEFRSPGQSANTLNHWTSSVAQQFVLWTVLCFSFSLFHSGLLGSRELKFGLMWLEDLVARLGSVPYPLLLASWKGQAAFSVVPYGLLLLTISYITHLCSFFIKTSFFIKITNQIILILFH